MKKSVRKLLFFGILVILGVGLFYAVGGVVSWSLQSPERTKYRQIQNGMSVEQVEAILGPGKEIAQTAVPRYVAAVNPQDAKTADERARREGRYPATVRDYPVRLKYFVEGDHILLWETANPLIKIYVAFSNGRVCSAFYEDLNYW